MANLYFEDAEIGTICAAGPYLVKKNEIIQFAKQYDPVPRHLDGEAAARSIFGGLTASSAHTFAVFISLTPKLQPRLHVLAGMGFDELRLPNAVRPGDELDLETTVLSLRPCHCGTVSCSRWRVRELIDQTLFSFKATLRAKSSASIPMTC